MSRAIQSQEPKRSFFPKKFEILALLISMSSIFQVFTSLQAPILALYLAQQSSQDLRHVGAIMAVYTFTSAVFSSVASVKWIRYRYGLLLLSYLLFFLYSIAMYYEPSVYFLYLIQFFGGISAGIGWSAFIEIFVNNVPKSQYTEYYSFNRLAGYGIGSIASAGSGFFATYFGIETIFLLMGGVALISMTLAAILRHLNRRGIGK